MTIRRTNGSDAAHIADGLRGSCLAKSREPRYLHSIALNAIRTNRAFRVVAVLVILLGWLVLSNHCALGEIGSRMAAKQPLGCCHSGTSKPVREPTNGEGMMECCKSLHALAPEGAKFADVPTTFVVWTAAPFALLRESRPRTVVVAFGDTGPPRGPSFSELVLHRSLRSHAPPFLA